MRFEHLREGAAWLAICGRDMIGAAPRSALAGSAFAGGGVAVAVLALLTLSFDDEPTRYIEPQSPTIETARLPRLRPDEPIATGSINRAAPAVPAANQQTPAPPLPPVPDAVDAQRLRERAVEAAESFDECDRVTASRSIEIGGLDLVRIECANGLGLYLDHAMVAARAAERLNGPGSIVDIPAPAVETVPSPPSLLTNAEAVARCEEQVRTGLPYPASLGRIDASTSVYRPGPSDMVVTFSFNTLSGLRFPLSQSAYCVFSDSRLARAEITTPPN